MDFYGWRIKEWKFNSSNIEEKQQEMKKEIKELVDNYELADEDICDNVIDTGNEWELFDTVNIEAP